MAGGFPAPVNRQDTASHINPTYDGDEDGVVELADGVRVFATQSDVPADIGEGELVFISQDASLYVEDGT